MRDDVFAGVLPKNRHPGSVPDENSQVKGYQAATCNTSSTKGLRISFLAIAVAIVIALLVACSPINTPPPTEEASVLVEAMETGQATPAKEAEIGNDDQLNIPTPTEEVVQLPTSTTVPTLPPPPTLTQTATAFRAPDLPATATPVAAATLYAPVVPTAIESLSSTPELIATKTEVPNSDLELTLDETVAKGLSILTEQVGGEKWFNRDYTSEEVVEKMQITDPELIELCRAWFDGSWEHPVWPSEDFHGLGILTITEEGSPPALHSAAGLLYGFVLVKESYEDVNKAARDAGITPRPRYLILQIVPGKKLTPEKNPDAFVAVKIGMSRYGGMVNAAGFAIVRIADSEFEILVINRNTQSSARPFRGTDAWEVSEMEQAFQLKLGQPVLVQGRAATPGELTASWFYIISNEWPNAEIQSSFSFFLSN